MKNASELKTDYQNMSLPPSVRLPDMRCLGVGARLSKAIFYRIEVLEVTGKGKLLREAAATSPAVPTTKPVPTPSPAQEK